MAKCKKCRRKKAIFQEGLCRLCWQEDREKRAREGAVKLAGAVNS
jgi:hypothetical protein